MWTLPVPDAADALEDLETALTLANGKTIYPISALERAAIRLLYTRYDQLLGQPSPDLRAATLTDAFKEAIQRAYGEVQEGRRLHHLRERLKLAAERCPFCGIGPISDLDHHLPQSHYRALAIYSRNLVPACHTCNNKKKTVAGDSPDAQFVHAYFDQVPSGRFLFTDVAVEEGAVTFRFRIECPAAMPEDLAKRISFQVSRLELATRYLAEVNVYLGSQEVSLLDAFGGDQGGAAVREYLLRSADVSERRFGLNDWRTTLLYGLAECGNFCDGGFRRLYVSANAPV